MPHTVDFQPIGRHVTCRPGESLLAAAQQAGIALNATCGGQGSCGNCVVRVLKGRVPEPGAVERSFLSETRLAEGWRLACQVPVDDDMVIYLPPESLATAQRAQVEGAEAAVELDPAIEIRPGTHPLGLAVDLGTTKLAAYLVDLASGETLAAGGAMNPQIAYGEDVIARIHHALTHPGGAGELRAAAAGAIHDLACELAARIGKQPKDILDAVVVGNTAMHHLFLGLPVSQLGLAPYVPAVRSALDVPAREAGLELAPAASVHLLPNIAGFVGADHVAMLLGSGMLEMKGVVLGMDIGTNTEVSLVVHGKHYACSTASGPAFEGAHIRHGMRAAAGAIEKVLIQDGELFLQTIEDQPPVGICGSGMLDLVAQLRLHGIINEKGAFDRTRDDPRLRPGQNGLEYLVATGANGEEITVDRHDIQEIQLAKGAMRAGVAILLQKAGITEGDIDRVVIAGAFGTYLDVASGIAIGMFPRIGRERFTQVGNAAGTGARMALLSMKMRRQAVDIARGVRYVELTTEKEFTAVFTQSLMLE